MRFRIEQRFAADVDGVAKAYTDPALYERLAGQASLGRPEFLDCREENGLLLVDVRYRFGGQLSAAARRVVDPAKLSWVEHSVHDLDRRHVEFHLAPDNYADRLRSSGRYTFMATDEGAVRITEGELNVRVALVAGAVERAIVSGLSDHLAAEVPVVEEFLGA